MPGSAVRSVLQGAAPRPRAPTGKLLGALGAGLAVAAGLACFDPNAPFAPCSDWTNCPEDQHCDPDARRCAPGAALPAITSFTATPSRVACPGDIVFTAVFSGGAGRIDPGVGAVTSGSSLRVTPAVPAGARTTYTLTVAKDAGRPVARTLDVYSSNIFSAGPAVGGSGSAGATATRLRCGKVLLAGGSGSRVTSLFDAYGSQGGPALATNLTGLAYGRANATATLLLDGRVLVAGGSDRPELELFEDAQRLATGWDRCSGAFQTEGALQTPRSFATATLLPGGQVLIAGGGDAQGAGALASAELVDPTGPCCAVTVRPAGPMAEARTQATATPLLDGRVLIAGGIGKDGVPLASAELYDPAANGGAGGFRSAGGLAQARAGATATLLPSGRVLVAGGSVYAAPGTRTGALATVELYTPAADGGPGSFASAGAPLSAGRSDASAVLLGNGQVLITGGYNAAAFSLRSSEFYDPSLPGAGTGGAACDTGVGSGIVERVRPGMALLPDGRVLVAGGESAGFGTALFDPAGRGTPGDPGTFTDGGGFDFLRIRATATLLLGGTVLVAGGINSSSSPAALLVDPTGHGQPPPSAPVAGLSALREGATATRLRDGRVLLAGGSSLQTRTYLASAEIYTPAAAGPGSFRPTGSLAAARADAAAVLLLDGRVAIFGGRSDAGVLGSAEIFDPAGNGGQGSFGTVETTLQKARYQASATLLPSGAVLLAGGTGPDGSPLDEVELFDPAAGWSGRFRWAGFPSGQGQLATPRSSAVAILLGNGKVLFAGGFGPGYRPTATAELFDVSTEQVVPAGNLGEARSLAAAALLPSGKVLILGGLAGSGSTLDSAELFDPFAARFVALGRIGLDAAGRIRAAAGSTATPLQDGRVLFLGGEGDNFFGGWLLYGLE